MELVAKSNPTPEIVLVGQPNCGKSTIFNQVAGYRSIATNFSGATVAFTSSLITNTGRTYELVDLPGIYSFVGTDAASSECKQFLSDHPFALIINVVDASLLSRSLELTLQLLELGRPMVMCLNMMDEAERKGVVIDPDKLSVLLGVPVIPTIAAKGSGIDKLFQNAMDMINQPVRPIAPKMSRHVEEAVNAVSARLSEDTQYEISDHRLWAIRLLEDQPEFTAPVIHHNGLLWSVVKHWQKKLEKDHGQSADSVIAAERHALSMHLAEQVTTVSHPIRSWRMQLDKYIMHPIAGYLILMTVLYALFVLIFKMGALLEQPVLELFSAGTVYIKNVMGNDSLLAHSIIGIIQGLAGGTAIVLPYLLPFLLAMAFLEDIGYLPRIAFLMDNFMHRIGLHGTAVIPGILGFGCTVPAIMATRILPSARDRFIAAVAALLVPCSARMTIILGLVGFYLGGKVAFAIYLFNIVVITLVGTLLARLMPADSPGMILEIPPYQSPRLKALLAKTWLRSKDFLIFAWPILIFGSLVLSLAEAYHWDHAINEILSPVTKVLDLPLATGTTLIFGILRKELSMIMLMQALGTTDVASVMSSVQLIVFTLFVVFYFPCLATFGVLTRELGWGRATIASMITLILAISIGVGARFILPLVI